MSDTTTGTLEEKVAALAKAVIEVAQRNPANLTDRGVESAVAARIVEFIKKHEADCRLGSADIFTVRRPTKRGWYWVRTPNTRPRLVEVTPSGVGGAMHASNMGDVSDLIGCKWCGPLKEPK